MTRGPHSRGRKSPAFTEGLVCADCGKVAVRTGPVQKYCSVCSGRRDTERKRIWAQTHHQDKDPEKARASHKRRRGLFDEAGRIASEVRDAELPEPLAGVESRYRVARRVSVPFSSASSKNAIWRTGKGGHVYSRREAVNYRQRLSELIYPHGCKDDWFVGKVWIHIFVEKPNHRSDAVNVVDMVCDAAKVAIGVDDRWFSLAEVDWAVKKNDPQIHVVVGQHVDGHMRICSHCGFELELTEQNFCNSKTGPLGFIRCCKQCERDARILRKKQKEIDTEKRKVVDAN